MDSDTTKIPYSAEYLEAIQAETDRKRNEFKASLSQDELLRLDAIEQASALLEKAQVHFILYGDVYQRSDTSCWFQFHKLNYNLPEGGEKLRDAVIEMKRRLVYGAGRRMMGWFAGFMGAEFVGFYDNDKNFLFGYLADVGKSQDASPVFPESTE